MSGPGTPSELGNVVSAFLDQLPPSLSEVVVAAAVPHAFGTDLLAALLQKDPDHAAELCRQLQHVPFVQTLDKDHYTLHEMVRDHILGQLWNERRDQYRIWSERAAEHLQTTAEDETCRLEALYHWLVADPDRGADLVWDWGADWNNAFQYEWVESLVQLGLEHDIANRLTGRARGWIYYRKGQTHGRYSENRDALTSLMAALEAGRGDRQLEANCIQALGDVHRMQAEYAAGRERYEEALHLFESLFPPDHPSIAWVRDSLESLEQSSD